MPRASWALWSGFVLDPAVRLAALPARVVFFSRTDDLFLFVGIVYRTRNSTFCSAENDLAGGFCRSVLLAIIDLPTCCIPEQHETNIAPLRVFCQVLEGTTGEKHS